MIVDNFLWFSVVKTCKNHITNHRGASGCKWLMSTLVAFGFGTGHGQYATRAT